MFAAIAIFSALVSLVFAPITGRDVYEQDVASFDSQNRPLWDSLCSALGLGVLGCEAPAFNVSNAGRLELVAYLCEQGVEVQDGESTGTLRMAAMMICDTAPVFGAPLFA